ncbi:triose-phosphate isomerase [Alteromonadaceae bacterium BrNp21-10]|nr:triose-phosphate isomerase [Alteromonadaceae bacterium BrNp21-10]
MQHRIRRPIVAGNWKMNGNAALVGEMQQALESQQFENVSVVVCPPLTYLGTMQSDTFSLGAQNTSDKASGAYTGETSLSMLQECAVEYVIVGHSERREYYAENDQVVAAKVAAVLEAGLTPIFCIGESEQVRDAGKLFEFLASQIDAVLNIIGINAFANVVIAYEPIWAIGTGKTATPEQAQEVHAFIRQHIAKQNGEIAEKMQILYGGSVNGGNAQSIFSQPDVDGGLVGGASLKPNDFITICLAANELR